MSARDELAKLLGDHESMGCGCCAYGPTTSEQSSVADSLEVSDYMVVLADAILAAGYSKPRTISTVAELDALPVGSVVADLETGHVSLKAWQSKHPRKNGTALSEWKVTGDESEQLTEDLTLPATVLYAPKES